jgi:hypothetical protein
VFFYLVQVGVQYDPAFLPLGNVSAPIVFTVFPAVAARSAEAYASGTDWRASRRTTRSRPPPHPVE